MCESKIKKAVFTAAADTCTTAKPRPPARKSCFCILARHTQIYLYFFTGLISLLLPHSGLVQHAVTCVFVNTSPSGVINSSQGLTEPYEVTQVEVEFDLWVSGRSFSTHTTGCWCHPPRNFLDTLHCLCHDTRRHDSLRCKYTPDNNGEYCNFD